MRIPGWRGMATDSLVAPHRSRSCATDAARRRATVERRVAGGSNADVGRVRRRRSSRGACSPRSPPDERVMWLVWTWGIVSIARGLRRYRHPSLRRRRDGRSRDARRDTRWIAAVVDRDRGRARSARLRRASCPPFPTRPTTGIGRGISRPATSTIRPSSRWLIRLGDDAPRAIRLSATPLARSPWVRSSRDGSPRSATVGDRATTRRRRRARDPRGDHHQRASARRRGTRFSRRPTRRCSPRPRSTLYCVVRALERPPRSRASLRWWIAHRLALGVAFCSKYTSIFLPVGVLIAFVIAHPSLRARFGSRGRTSRARWRRSCFLPVLVWNASARTGSRSSIRCGTDSRAPQGSALAAAWKHEGDFFGGQAALASPILFIMLGDRRRARRSTGATDAERFVLGVVALVSFRLLRLQRAPPARRAELAGAGVHPGDRAARRDARGACRREVVARAASCSPAAMSLLDLRAGSRADSADSPREGSRSRARSVGTRSRARRGQPRSPATRRSRSTRTGSAAIAIRRRRSSPSTSPAHPTTFATNLSGRAESVRPVAALLRTSRRSGRQPRPRRRRRRRAARGGRAAHAVLRQRDEATLVAAAPRRGRDRHAAAVDAGRLERRLAPTPGPRPRCAFRCRAPRALPRGA